MRLRRATRKFSDRLHTRMRPVARVLDSIAGGRILTIAIAVFIIALGFWTVRVGVRIRDDAWRYSRSIRYHGDVRNGFRWGREVVDSAIQNGGGGLQNGIPRTAASVTIPELIHAEDRLYRDLVANVTDGDYQLDYPPLRLLVMSLWSRHVEVTRPGLDDWPNKWELHYSATGDPTQLATEDIVQPLLKLNTLNDALCSVFAFFLVWIWVNRGDRARMAGQRRPARWNATAPSAASGLIAFPLTAGAFVYALTIVTAPAPVPPPTITFDGPAEVSHAYDGVRATIPAIVNCSGPPAQCYIEWGTQAGAYDHTTFRQFVQSDGADQPVQLRVDHLPAESQIHFRFIARNEQTVAEFGGGITRTEDSILDTRSAAVQPTPPSSTFGDDVWPDLWLWLEIVIVFAAMCWSMSVLPGEHRGWACGLVAAGLIWFNPILLVDGHMWPQWDVWLLPPFLLAAILASLDWWFCAGLIIGLGMMFKGQFLVGAPVFFIWPIFSMRWGALLRMLIGTALFTAVLLSPWIALDNKPFETSLPVVHWIARVLIAMGIAVLLSLLRELMIRDTKRLRQIDWRSRAIQAGAAAIIIGFVLICALVMVAWPADSLIPKWIGLGLLLGILIPPWFLRKRTLGIWVAAIVSGALWSSAWIYHTDWAWKKIGFDYGTAKFDKIAMSEGANANLPSILARRFNWHLHDRVMTLHLPMAAPIPLDLRQMMILIFGILIVICGASAAMHDRRNSPRFLAALVAPWLLMPTLLCQMANRYQLWGTVLSAMLVGIWSGFGVMTAIISLLATGMIGLQLLQEDPGRSPALLRMMHHFAPDGGWILLCAAVIVLMVAMTPGKRVDSGVVKLDSPLSA